MKIKVLKCSKTKTVEVSGLLGKDAYRKFMWGAEAEVEEGETEIEAKQTLSAFIDMAIADEVTAMNEEVAAKKKSLGLS